MDGRLAKPRCLWGGGQGWCRIDDYFRQRAVREIIADNVGQTAPWAGRLIGPV